MFVIWTFLGFVTQSVPYADLKHGDFMRLVRSCFDDSLTNAARFASRADAELTIRRLNERFLLDVLCPEIRSLEQALGVMT